MIEIGYKFPHNGAVVLATSPADNDSIIVLCKETWGAGSHRGEQYVTGRVYVHQLPHPESWDNGTYSQTVENAVEHWIARAGLLPLNADESTTAQTVKYLSALIRNAEKHLEAQEHLQVAVKHGWDSGPHAESVLTLPDGGTARVLLYRSPAIEHGVSVQVETDDLISHIRVMLNDGDLFAGNPETEVGELT